MIKRFVIAAVLLAAVFGGLAWFNMFRDQKIREAFAQYVRGAQTIVLCGDDAGAAGVPTPNTAEIIRYGTRPRESRLLAAEIRAEGGGTRFDCVYDGAKLGELPQFVKYFHHAAFCGNDQYTEATRPNAR